MKPAERAQRWRDGADAASVAWIAENPWLFRPLPPLSSAEVEKRIGQRRGEYVSGHMSLETFEREVAALLAREA